MSDCIRHYQIEDMEEYEECWGEIRSFKKNLNGETKLIYACICGKEWSAEDGARKINKGMRAWWKAVRQSRLG